MTFDETRFMELLRDLQRILDAALNSLAGTEPPTSVSHYISWAALFISRTSAGYIILHDAGQIHSSKLLIRPALETTFAAAAAVKDPKFLYRKAYSEWLEINKLFTKDTAGKMAADQELKELDKAFRQDCPQHPVEKKKIKIEETAQMAGVSAVYQGAYRIYCQFTHGALHAVMGDLDEATDRKTAYTMAWCVLMMLDLLQKNSPAQIPDLTAHKRILKALKRGA